MNYLYFAEGTVDSTHEAAMYPASSFTGFDPISTTTTRLSFKAANGTAADDDILIAHTGKHHKVAELIASLMEPSSVTTNKFIVVADEVNGVYADAGIGAGLNGTVEVTLA
tara:strand:- start:384 stop:716 length:333 start_codon:yes stop_codon:yes gene_type:complete